MAADLRTTYMGIPLAHPIVASASPLSKDTDGVRRLEDAGAAAVVMFSLFEEQIRREEEAYSLLSALGAESQAEAAGYFPALPRFRVGPDRYLELLERATEAVKIPVIASLNGVSASGWVEYARLLHRAGAAAIELNVYHVAGLEESGRDVEARYLDILRSVKAVVPVPVAMKLSPFFSSMGHMARQLDEAGADGLVLFNRFYQPDFDLERMEVVPSLDLSAPAEARLPLRWIALLHGRVRASLAATTGVESGVDVVKYLLAGADAVMTTSSLLRHGLAHLGKLHGELRAWLDERGYDSVAQMKGAMSQRKVEDPAAFERSNYIQVLERYRV